MITVFATPPSLTAFTAEDTGFEPAHDKTVSQTVLSLTSFVVERRERDSNYLFFNHIYIDFIGI
jgi:hypothetical protein